MFRLIAAELGSADTSIVHAVFQQLDVDYYVGAPDKQLYHTDLLEAPILRIFGVTEQGNSVCLFVHGFEPYFFVESPPGWGPDECDALCNDLNVRIWSLLPPKAVAPFLCKF